MSDEIHGCWTIGDNANNQQCELQRKIVWKLKKIHPCDNIKNIVTGKYGSTYIISGDGKLIVFGNNDRKQLGITNDTFIYIIISHFTQHLCFIPFDILLLTIKFCGDIFADSFHYNKYNEQTHSVPIEIFINEIKLISNGIAANHKFIMTITEELYGIGCNRYDQLGIGSYNVSALNKIVFFDNLNIKIIQIECGYTFSTFLTLDGKLYVCGRSYDGALGLGKGVRKTNKFKMIKFLKHLNMKQIATGDEHTLALNENGGVFSWGNGSNGQLGHGNKKHIYTPKKIKYFDKQTSIEMIGCGSDHTVMLNKKGSVYCCGRNTEFQCGNNSNENILVPELNKTLQDINIIEIKCGYNHNCVKTKDNQYFLWGYNKFNQCLLYNGSQYVKIPTQFNTDNSFGHTITSVFPGFYETRIITLD